MALPPRLCSGEDRSHPKSTMGKSPRSAQGRSHPGKADALGSCAKEDRRRAEGAMGEGKGGEEDGLRFAAEPSQKEDSIVTAFRIPSAPSQRFTAINCRPRGSAGQSIRQQLSQHPEINSSHSAAVRYATPRQLTKACCTKTPSLCRSRSSRSRRIATSRSGLEEVGWIP